jgi:polyribonucleotide nucleotidyltransferase
MDKALALPRSELPPTVPKMSQFSIPEDSIGKVIGPGGRQIRAIIEDFDLVNMDVGEDGSIQLTSMEASKLTEAEAFVKSLIAGGGGGRGGSKKGREPRPQYVGPDPEEGVVYKGKIKGAHAFGVFVEILPGAEDGSTPGLEGLCHVSELHVERVRNVEGYIKSLNTEELEVMYLGVNDKGQIRLSRKAVLEDRLGIKSKEDRRPSKKTQADPPDSMSQDELDVIAQAIEGIKDM